MTKLCWYEEDQYRRIVDDASHLLEKGAAGQPGLYLLGLKLLSMLVSEMNQPTPGRTLTQHRKIAVAFRDQSLLKTFVLSLSALKQLQNTSDLKLKEQVRVPNLHVLALHPAEYAVCCTTGMCTRMTSNIFDAGCCASLGMPIL